MILPVKREVHWSKKMRWFYLSFALWEGESAKLRTLRAHVPTCLACLRAHMLRCLAYLRAHMPRCLVCSRANMPCVFICSCANVPTCLVCLCARVITCLRTNVPCVFCVPTYSRAITTNGKDKFSIICFPYIFVIVLCLFPAK